MAMQFMDGFDYYAAAHIGLKGWNGPATMTSGRFGGQGIFFTSGGTTSRSVPSLSSFTLGIAAKVSTANFLTLNAAGALLQLVVTGGVFAINNGSGARIATGTVAVVATNWNYYELKVVINGASSTIATQVNGAADIPSTICSLGATPVSSWTYSRDGATVFDDIYLCDATGTANNGFHGDVRIATDRPTGAGHYTQWTGVSGANWTNVDDTTPDDDTTYNKDANVGDIDSFTTAGVDPAATVYAVQTSLYARKDDTGVRQVATLLRQSSIDYLGATDTLASSYSYFTDLFDKDPSGSVWTATTFNAEEFGYKLVA